MAAGIDFRTAPSKDWTAEIAEETCFFALAETIGVEDEAACRADVLFFFFSAFSAASALSFFFSTLASVSASHGAFTFPRDAGRLLFHCAEPSSPAIPAMVRLLSTERSYCSMS